VMKRRGAYAGLLSTAAALAACGISAQAAQAAKPEEDEGGKVTISGFLDWYYQYSFNHPPVGSLLSGRSFDVKNDAFSLAVLQVNVVRAPSKNLPVGLTVTGTVGKTADIVHGTEPGTRTVRFLQQAYATYATESAKPLTIDVGKFVTHMGMEVIESASNDNYSRSLLFNYAIPFYHTGVRVAYPLTPTLTGQLHFVNGWNNVEDDNGGKSIGAQLAWNPNAAWTWVVNYMGGDESTGAALPANLNVQMVDLLGIWRPTAKLKLGINLDYASASKPGTPGGNWNGQAIYGRYQLSSTNAIAIRAEHFEDTNGLRSGAAQNINEITATLEHAWKNLLMRLEFRHDHAGTKFFPSGGGGSTDQDTLTLGGVVKF
jgi:hypothetical protein